MPRPEVVTGLRQPTRSAGASADEAGRAQAKPYLTRSSGTVYESVYPQYRIQLTSPDEDRDPKTGRRRGARPMSAQFQDNDGYGVYVNDARDPETRQLVDDIMQSNPFYGLGKHFWKLEDRVAKQQKQALDSTARTLKSIPKDVLEAFIKQEGLDKLLAPTSDAEDIELPPAEGKTKK